MVFNKYDYMVAYNTCVFMFLASDPGSAAANRCQAPLQHASSRPSDRSAGFQQPSGTGPCTEF